MKKNLFIAAFALLALMSCENNKKLEVMDFELQYPASYDVRVLSSPEEAEGGYVSLSGSKDGNTISKFFIKVYVIDDDENIDNQEYMNGVADLFIAEEYGSDMEILSKMVENGTDMELLEEPDEVLADAKSRYVEYTYKVDGEFDIHNRIEVMYDEDKEHCIIARYQCADKSDIAGLQKMVRGIKFKD